MRESREYGDRPEREKRRWSFARSGWATALIVAGVLLTFGVAWRAHQKAQFHQLTAPVIPQTISAPMPGGQEASVLSRVALVNDSEPEFVSATVLPGIGMQILQATVAVPDRGQQDLLVSAPVNEVAQMPTEGVVTAPFHLRIGTRHLADRSQGDDLIGLTPAIDAQNQTLVDGGQATGSFRAAGTRFGVAAVADVTLSGRQIDLIVHASSNAEESRFLTFEWRPKFAAPAGDLSRLILTVPSHTDQQNATLRSLEGTALDFSVENGARVPARNFDLHLVKLTHEFLGDGTSFRLQSGAGFYLRILGLGDTLRSLQVTADPATNGLLLGVSSFDPTADPERRDQTLRPGQTLQWHIRMEILPLKGTSGSSPSDETR